MACRGPAQSSRSNSVKLVWSGPAAADRREIRAWIARDDPVAAVRLDQRVSDAAQLLLDHPDLGRPGRVFGTRELVIHQNYILVCDLAGDLVRVLRILHAARQWPGSLPTPRRA